MFTDFAQFRWVPLSWSTDGFKHNFLTPYVTGAAKGTGKGGPEVTKVTQTHWKMDRRDSSMQST